MPRRFNLFERRARLGYSNINRAQPLTVLAPLHCEAGDDCSRECAFPFPALVADRGGAQDNQLSTRLGLSLSLSLSLVVALTWLDLALAPARADAFTLFFFPCKTVQSVRVVCMLNVCIHVHACHSQHTRTACVGAGGRRWRPLGSRTRPPSSIRCLR